MSTIFTFWEPRAAVVPYIGLCMKTWPRVVKADEIVVLDYANLPAHIGDALDLDLLRRVPLPIQKDAVMAAVLHRRGGAFLDADTLAVRDIAPLMAMLEHTEIVIFGLHMGFMAARPGARLLVRWLPVIAGRLAALRDPATAPPEIPWDYLGNGILPLVMDDVIREDAGGRLPLAAVEDALGRAEHVAGLGRAARRLGHSLRWRRRLRYFRTRYRRYLTSLDRDRYAFMPERLRSHHSRTTTKMMAAYQRYWFESSAGADTVLRDRQMLIALHNSWTPEWYKRLSEREVLAHPCRLSRTLRRLLED